MSLLATLIAFPIIAASSENKGRFRHLLIHVCVGRLWAKIYCRQNAEENKGGRLVISTLCHLVADFEEFLQRQNYQCSRCQRMGRASQVLTNPQWWPTGEKGKGVLALRVERAWDPEWVECVACGRTCKFWPTLW